MQIEEAAIQPILTIEPTLKRTPPGNAGFDLFENDGLGKAICWVEVKAMTGSFAERPVCLSRSQFDLALQQGSAYWLYVVEHATNSARFRVLRIQNPVGNACYFTFNAGWAEIALLGPTDNAGKYADVLSEFADEESAS